MAAQLRASNDQIANAYAEAGSCKGAAKLLGMCAQSVHERLVKLGLSKSKNVLTDADRSVIAAEYQTHADAGKLEELAARLGRSKAFICRVASEMGMTNPARTKKYLAEQISERQKAKLQADGHPRGMLGKKHSPEAKAQIGKASKNIWDSMTADQRSAHVMKQLKAKAAAGGLARPRPETTWKAGWREIGGQRIYCRSRWEANYARYLEWLRARGHLAKWEHEPETFWFERIKRGCRSYLPDFRVTENNGSVIYHEVKGWMDDRSKTKINRMRIYHPKVVLVVIDSKQYAEINRKVSSLVPGWES